MKKQILIPLTIILLFYYECALVGNNTDTPPVVEKKEGIERMR